MYARPSGNIIVGVGNWYVKIPRRIRALGENRTEIKNLRLALKDFHFSSHVPRHKAFGPMIAIERLSSFSIKDQSSIMDIYWKKSFRDIGTWPPCFLENIIESRTLKQFTNSLDDINLQDWIHLKCKTVIMPKSSSHGDFHPENILVDIDKRLKFIDWTRYSIESSRYFDVVNYLIFSQKRGETLWFDYWNELYARYPGKFYNLEIAKAYFLGYALWKISKELQTLYERRTLDKYKIKKYRVMLKKLSSLNAI